MGTQAKLESALKLLHRNKFVDATKSYKKIIKKKPHSFDAHRHLAYCYYRQNKIKDSEKEFLLALELQDNHAETRNNLGYLYLLESEEFEKAKCEFEKVIKLYPNEAEYHHNLGNSLRQLHQYEKANSAYSKAINLNQKESKYYDSLGYSLSQLGLFNESLDAYKKAHNLNKKLSSVYVHLFDLLMLMQIPDDATNIASNCIAENIVSGSEQNELLIGMAQNDWLLGSQSSLELNLSKSSNILSQNTLHPGTTNLRIFHKYLSLLHDIRITNESLYVHQPDTRSILMISESHGFSPCGTSVKYKNETNKIVSFLVTGGKMWNMAQQKNNCYKQSVEQCFTQASPNSTIIMGFGEIDCRPNEGIFPHHIKHKTIIKEDIAKVVVNYIKNMLESANKFGHSLIFYGVPAPHPEMLSTLNQKQRTDYLLMVKLVNQQLIDSCKKYGCSMLDVYSLTNDGHGISNLVWHIDNIHLHPKTFATLFSKHLTSTKDKCSQESLK